MKKTFIFLAIVLTFLAIFVYRSFRAPAHLEGAEAIAPGKTVLMHLEGRLANGKVFETTENRDPVTFMVGEGRIPKGLEDGVLGMKPGEEATIHVPAAMAYGKFGAGKIVPPNSDLLYHVKIVEVK